MHPYTLDLCVFYEAGDAASLAVLRVGDSEGATDVGLLSPPFDPAVFEYAVVVDPKFIPDMTLRLVAVTTHKGATVRLGSCSGRRGINAGWAWYARLGVRAGENNALVCVTSPSGLVSRLYKVTIYVLTSGWERFDDAEPSLAMLAVRPGLLEPSFSPDEFKYTASLEHRQRRMTVTAAAMRGGIQHDSNGGGGGGGGGLMGWVKVRRCRLTSG